MLSHDLQVLRSFLASRTDAETGELYLTNDERASVALLLEAAVAQLTEWERSARPAPEPRDPSPYDLAVLHQQGRRSLRVIQGGKSDG